MQTLFRYWTILFIVLGMVVSLRLPASAAEKTVEQRREELAKVKESLADPDPLARLASMEAVVASGDATASALAVRTAFASDDPQLRNLAMRTWVAGLKRLTVDILLPSDLQAKVDQAILDPKRDDGLFTSNKWLSAWATKSFQCSLGFTDIDLERNTGKVFSGTDEHGATIFTITGTQVFLTVTMYFATMRPLSCVFRLSPSTSMTLQGTVSCDFGFPSPKLSVSAPML